jgi:large subunit ribosomal protein L21
MEFAVLKTGGKQYKVSVGDEIAIEMIKGEYKVGDKLTFEEVLLKDDGKKTTIGTPTIAKAAIEATVTEIGKLDKVTVIRYRQKSRYYKKNGHKQPYMGIKIEAIK